MTLNPTPLSPQSSVLSTSSTSVGPITLHHVEAGSGSLVVLLHGFPEFWYSWRKQIPALAAAGHRVIAVDLRGYNESSKPREVEAYKIMEVVKDIAGLIVQNGGTCALVGHDWGGVVAWFLAMMHPALVERLVILNAPHPVPYARELRNNRAQKVRALYQLFFAMPLLPQIALKFTLASFMRRAGRFTEEELREYGKVWRKPFALTAMTHYYRAMAKHRRELRQLVRPIEVPVLLIWGERDPVFVRATTENFSEYVPNLRVERIANAGHFVQTDAPEKVNQLLVDFLAQQHSTTEHPTT